MLLISFTTNDGDRNLLVFNNLPAHPKLGVCLHRAALATFNWRPVNNIDQETEQIRQENKRLAGLNSRMDALLRNADSSSQTPPATDSN